MKKLVLTTMAVVAGAMLSHAQGSISLQGAKGVVQTNGATLGLGSGNLSTTALGYYFEVLDMSQSTYAGLTGSQSNGVANLFANGADASLWTDTGVSGVNQTSSLTAGGVIGEGTATGTSAANWGAPTGNVYATGTIDYYVIVGWSSNEGTSWATVASELENNSWQILGAGAWFGETAVGYNYSGGGPNTLNAVNVWGTSSASGLAGSGLGGTNPELVLTPVPEPTTLALAGLGGISMLFLRRRKA